MVDLNLSDLKDALMSEEDHDLEYTNLNEDKTILAFKSSKYNSYFQTNLKEFFDTGKFCDIILKSSSNPNEFIRAHKLVLACVSPYFKAMFAGGFREDNQCQEITVEQINFSILEIIIEFIYTSKVIVKDTNVEQLLPAAKMLQIEDMVKACCIYLCVNMDASNCISIAEFAKAFGCIKLIKKAQIYLRENFCEVSHHEEFLNLTKNQLCKILNDDELGVPCETLVFKAIVNWVKYDAENRRSCFENLFRCLRFSCMPPKFLEDQMNNELFKCKDTDKPKQIMKNAIRDLLEHKQCGRGARKPALGFSLYVIGGYQKQSINVVECLTKTSSKWERCAEMITPRSGVTCVTYFLYIFAIGGRNNSSNGNTDCADVEMYDPFLNLWTKRASLTVPRSRAAAGLLDGLIYVVGGAHGSKYHSSVERFYEKENRWEKVTPMKVARIGLGCAVVNRLLYAIGGYDGVNRHSIVERFNPDENEWCFVQPMSIARSGAGVCALDQYIYVVGGYTTNLQLNSVERYDTVTNQWTFVNSMESPRSALACIAWNDKIFALGGYNGSEFLSTVEAYNPEDDKWEQCIPLLSERSGHGIAISVEVNRMTIPTSL